jgi:murein DD-endopeptidase MepM/ murein hydrolase activator NlpD
LVSDILHTAQSAALEALLAVRRHPARFLSGLALLLIGATGGSYALVSLAPEASELPVRIVVEAVEPLSIEPQRDLLAAQAMRLYRSDVTRSTDTADSLLRRLGVSDPAASAFLRADRNAQKNLLGRAGRIVQAEVDERGRLVSLTARWSPEDDGTFNRLMVRAATGAWKSTLETLPLTASTRMASGTIQTSLFAATDDARIPDGVAVQMAEIFSGDIDFHRALRKGDRFVVVYETLEGDGEPLRSGRVLSTEFVNAGKSYQALWFESLQSAQNGKSPLKGAYYNMRGESLRRAFLASPVAFSRITSGFAMRFHPILRTWRAHLGVDYGAVTGTPVRTVADGVVDFAGVQGGYGNVVIVKHGGNTTTVYAHLSRVNVRNGQRVQQGDNIGLVGATGWATGPHLHFEFRVNGAHKDPMTIARQAEATPVTAALRPAFDRAAGLARQQLTAAGQVHVGSVQ